MADPKYKPEVAARANELIKQGVNPQKAAEQAFKENKIDLNSDEVYLYTINAVDPSKPPFLQQEPMSRIADQQAEQNRTVVESHSTIVEATVQNNRIEQVLVTNKVDRETKDSLAEQHSANTQRITQAEQALSTTPNGSSVVREANTQASRIATASQNVDTVTETVTGGGSVTRRLEKTPESAKWDEDQKKLKAEITADNRRARDEYLAAKGLTKENSTPAERLDAVLEGKRSGELAQRDFVTERDQKLGNRPDDRLIVETTPGENKTTTTETVRGTVSAQATDTLPTGETVQTDQGSTILTRATILSEEKDGQRVTTQRIVTDMTLANGSPQVKILDANGNIVSQGTSSEVLSQLQADPVKNADAIAAIQRHDRSLIQQREKFSSSDTARTSVDNTNAAVDTQTISPNSEAAKKIANGNKASPETALETASKTSTLPSSDGAQNADSAANNQASNEDSGQTNTVVEQQQPKPQTGSLLGFNPLDNLADYTYSFIISVLTPTQYNDVVNNKTTSYVKNNVIIASGSRNSETVKRNNEFTYDFYISELKFDTVIGLNSRTKGSNALALSFKLIEPMGASFFDRLYEMASNLGIKNYLEVPYLLVIEFRGNNDNGIPVVLHEHTKYLPMKLINANMRITAGGTEYQVDAIPFNQVSYLATEHGSTPVNLTVKAATVGDFFANTDNVNELSNQLEKDQRELKRDVEQQQSFATNFGFEATDNAQVKKNISNRVEQARKKYYNVSSYTQALNAFQLNLKQNNKILQPDIFVFDIHPDIANTKILDPKLLSGNRSVTSTENKGSSDSAVEAGQKGYFPINAGTSIINVINTVLRNSDYIKDQITEKAAKAKNQNDPVEIANTLEKPIRWFKIIPTVTINEYDFRRNTFARTITYHVVPHLVHNTKSPLAPKSFPSRWLHEYKYIFTGDNRSILDCEIKFDTMFFQMATANREQWDSWNSAPTVGDEVDNSRGFATSGSFTPLKTIYQSTNISNVLSSYDTETAKGVAVADFSNHLLSNMRGEMISIRLKIVGDPRYIKQDEIFYNPKNSPELEKELLSKNNSIVFDFEERYIKLLFYTPVDYGENGLLAVSEKYKSSKFSGLYRILRVENAFYRGKFEQTLDLIRLFDQPGDTRTVTKSERKPDVGTNNRSVAGPATQNTAGERVITTTSDATAEATQIDSSVTQQIPNARETSLSVSTNTTVPQNFSDAAADPNTNYNETPPTPGVTDQDRLEALRIQNESNNPEAITPEQVAGNRRLDERLLQRFGFLRADQIEPPSTEDYANAG